MPAGMREAEPLPEPLFTPTTKAETGHDLPHDRRRGDRARRRRTSSSACRDAALAIYERGAAHAASRGIILADTKFEFGFAPDGELLLIDEVLTPDSSRYWPADEYAVGGSPPSFDKQYVRDHYLTLDWDQTPPAPPLPGRRDRGHAAALRRGVRAHHRPVLRRLVRRLRCSTSDARSRPGSTSPTCPGILDPQGATVERALPALGYTNVSQVSVGKSIRLVLDADDEAAARAQVDEMCHRLLANPVIEAFAITPPGARWRERARVGVVQFPGTNCELDVAYAVEQLGGYAEILLHADRDLRGVDAVVVPGGFAHGDYLRTGAIARFSPVMDVGGRARRRRRPGRRDLQRLPGALRGRPAPGRAAEERRA